MNPARFSQMMKYLTRAKKEKPDLPDVFPASKAPIPSKTQNVEEIEAINRFATANPRQDMAGGGMLVQPGFGGTRQGYAKEKKKINRDESYRKVVKDFTATSGPGTGSVFDDPAAIEIVKANLNKIKKQRNNKPFFEWSENSDWYKALQKELNPNTKKGTNREYTNKLINKVVDEFFPGAYHGKNAIKNFRNDTVVKSFIQHLKSVGEFDGQEKFNKVLEQFKNPPKKGTPNNYESINKSWKQWIAGEFEVDGVDRAQLKKELKARGINYDETIGKWTASGAQLRGKDKIKELKTLNKLNRFTNKSVEEIKALFLKEHPNANFDLRVNELTQLKNTGVYVSGANSELAVTGIDKGDRAGWLKQAYGKQFAGNYSKIINAADQLAAAGETEKAKRLYKAADKFFGPTGIVRKSAVGEAEHALARSFDFLNPDRQLAINSIVSGDLNQFKKNLFDIPVKRYFDEYNNSNTTKARRVELKNLIEERKKVMNALTGGQKSGIVAGDIVNFRYGANEITATSSVKPIDTLFKEGKFDINEYIERGNKYTESFQAATKDIDIKKDFSTPINENKLSNLLKVMQKADPQTAKDVGMVLNSGIPIDQIAAEIARIPGAKKFARAFMKIGGPFEVAFLGLDIANEVSKGAPLDTSIQQGLSNFTLGLLGNPEKYQMRDLKDAGDELGVKTTGFQELKNILDLEKKINSEKKLLEDMKVYNEQTGESTLKGNFDIYNRSIQIKNLEKELQNKSNQLNKLDNIDTLFDDYVNSVQYLGRKEYNKTVEDRKNRVYPDMGSMGSDFATTILNPIKSFLPQNLMETGLGPINYATQPIIRNLRKLPVIGGIFDPTSDQAILSAMSPEEKDKRALDMKIVKQNYHPVMGQTMTGEQLAPYYEKFFAGGGIAKLAGVSSGPPPESGPNSQGLLSLKNRVRNY